MARAQIWDGLPGAKRSHSPCYGEHLLATQTAQSGARGARETCSALPSYKLIRIFNLKLNLYCFSGQA
jgi:hypothetical protein